MSRLTLISPFPLAAGVLLAALAVSCSRGTDAPRNNELLWFETPAKYWNSQALHLGNGYFGASFFGGVQQEVFALTHSAMWTGGPAGGDWESAGVNPRARGSIPVIREAVVAGDAARADSLITRDVFGSMERYGHFTSIGDLVIDFGGGSSGYRDYTRLLDLSRSLGRVQFTRGGGTVEREYFCSYPDRVLAMRITAPGEEMIRFRLGMKILQDSFRISAGNGRFLAEGWIDGNRRPFAVLAEVSGPSMVTRGEGDWLVVESGPEVVVLLTITTDYRLRYPDYQGNDPLAEAERILAEASGLGYRGLRERHISDYRRLFDRVTLDLPGDPEAERLPTGERFRRLRSGGHDPGYLEMAFHLGRYMIISSSRPGTLPANLQGVWNAFYVAPWAGNYQSNINLQEIYWSCGPANLIECQEPYIDWIADLARPGREIARRVYGTGGWVSHTTGNIWGHAAPIGNHPWGMYPVAAAWHCQHVWDHYLFTGDPRYLEETAYPLLRDASRFWEENLVPFRGSLITAPSVSAEHGALVTPDGLNPAFHDLRSDRYVYSLEGIYQDMQMIGELFSSTARAARLTGQDADAARLDSLSSKLLAPRVGKYGQLQEWYRDIDHPEGHHRHISHLYAVCPGTSIHPLFTPELAGAAAVSLNMRGDGRYPDQELASGGNWARAHRMWCWTRLGDGERGLKIMREMLTEQGFENGLTFQHSEYHWGRPEFYTEDSLYLHFQLDGSASLPGCLIEMVLQSHTGEIHLLPALPPSLADGQLTGAVARGGHLVDIRWRDGDLEEAVIRVAPGESLPPVRLRDKITEPDADPRIRTIPHPL